MSDVKTGENTVLEDLFRQQMETIQSLMTSALPGVSGSTLPLGEPADAQQWAMSAAKLQKMWLDFSADQAGRVEPAAMKLLDPARWGTLFTEWTRILPLRQAETQARLWEESLALWSGVLGQFGIGPDARPDAVMGDSADEPNLPRKDRRFADPRWRQTPAFALLHQTYLLLAERLTAMAEEVQGLPPARQEQLRFATRAIVDAMSPANFPLTNPVVIERTLETRGENLVKGVEHLLADLRKGQLTHTDPNAFELGRNIAATPGKVVHETPLYQLIQYSPVTENVLATPLLIFPPWINRFYILDLNPRNSFVRWAVDQGLTVFMVSWKSADASMADVTWDDFILGQVAAIDFVRERLKVPAVHTIGYCVGGTTLAATLALMARRDEAHKVASATFFTAQVDFEKAGELKVFVDEAQLKLLENLTTDGYLDGRYMALTFNTLRSRDLIWNYVVNNYLLGEDYPAFDLLHWNGDTTNLPFKWQKAYLEELYRDNRLVIPDSIVIDGTPLDLRQIKTPCFIQAGKEDHIAPAESVWKMTRHLSGPWTFMLAGSGHIAGVVNPPIAGKYQYWLNENDPQSLSEFIEGATETKGSWWPNWIEWLRQLDSATVLAKGKRNPGGRGDRVIEDAPGRYVRTR